MRETTRNALLRRVDWRFILGLGHVRRTAACASPDLTRAITAISDEVVELGPAAEGCDLVVLSNPDREALRRAHAALRPGGACYAEWTWPTPGAISRIERRLERAGFVEGACFWPWPPPRRASPHFWLPMQARGALRYFLASRPRPGGPREAGAAAARALWRLASRSQTLAPICAMAVKPYAHDGRAKSRGPAAAGPRPLAVTLRACWQEWGLGPAPQRVTCSMETGGRRSVNKVVVLVFADDEERPRMAVKLARVRESEPALAREAAALRALPRDATGGVHVPRLIFHEPLGGTPAIGLTPVEGQRLSTLLDVDGFRKHSLSVTEFLTRLASAGTPAPREEWFPRLAEPALARFEAAFGSVVHPSELGRARAAILALGDLPIVFEQRDLSPWNVLLGKGGELSLLDWESAEPRGLPLLDLIYFLTYGALFVEGTIDSGKESVTYSRMLEALSPAGEVFRECVARYLRAVAIEPAALAPLRVLLWMVHADSEHKRLVADAGGGVPTEAELLRSVCLRLWREDLARAGEGAVRARPSGPSTGP